MLEKNLRHQQLIQEGIVVSDPYGLVIAWRDGLTRRFSWDQLRQLSLNEEKSGQSVKQEPGLAQPATY